MTLDAFQSWVVQTGLGVSLLIVVILFVRRPFARMFGANATYALWSLPIIRLFLPAISIPQGWLPNNLFHTPEPVPALEVLPEITIEPVEMAGVLQTPEIATDPAISWVPLIITLWLGVAGLWLLFQLYQQSNFKVGLRAKSEGPSDALMKEIAHAANRVGLRKTPIVRVSSEGLGPLVTGVVKPLVILPHNFEKTFDLQQRHFALVHEFAHIKRCDLWVALATLIFRAVNWPNPLVHYASHKLRGDQEAACDAYVIKVTGGETTHSYAETLVKAVRQEHAISKSHSHLALSLTEAESEISKGD